MKKYLMGAVLGASLMVAGVASAAVVAPNLFSPKIIGSVPVGSPSATTGRTSSLVKVTDANGVMCYVVVSSAGEAGAISCLW